MKVYHFERNPDGLPLVYSKTNHGPARPLPDKPARALSPQLWGGWEWGYAGSGPLFLSLCLLLDSWDDPDEVLQLQHGFMWAVIRCAPRETWSMPQRNVILWARAALEELTLDTRFVVSESPTPEIGGVI